VKLNKTQLTINFIKDNSLQDRPNRQIARMLFEKYPAYFKDSEDARYFIRRVFGQVGEHRKNKIADKSLYMPAKKVTPFKIPEPDSEDFQPYKLPKNWDRFILAGDFHVPNHRIPPIEAMIKYAQDNDIKKFLLNGDLLDNTPFTRWLREPVTPSDVPRWFDMAIELLRYFKSIFDEVIFLEGNHDFWYKRYLMQKAPELFGDPFYELENRLKLNEIGIKFVPQEYLVKAGKLNIHYGHITFRGGGSYANAARMLSQKTKSSMICSHVHVESSHTEPNIDDTIATCFTTGCMCSLKPQYQPFGGKSCHGFADITVLPNGHFQVRNYRIANGEIL